jgi:hypothetical protein
MLNPNATSSAAPTAQFVSVHYGDGQQSFWLAADATLAELAARIDEMDDNHDGAPLLINVSLSTAEAPKPRPLKAQ